MDTLIVALDFPNEERALELVKRLEGRVGFFKVGLQLFTASGPQIVRRIQDLGAKVFLDLKFFDIPNTVSQAAVEAARLGVRMMTFHALGGEAMLRKAFATLGEHSSKEGWKVPQLLGVTILTSMDEASLAGVGIDRRLDKMVLHLAQIVERSGFHGLVCSPHELKMLRNCGVRDLAFVTPGIRPEKAPSDDQARAATAGQAIRDGADYLVVGRPITQAGDPRQVAEELIQEIEKAKTERA